MKHRLLPSAFLAAALGFAAPLALADAADDRLGRAAAALALGDSAAADAELKALVGTALQPLQRQRMASLLSKLREQQKQTTNPPPAPADVPAPVLPNQATGTLALLLPTSGSLATAAAAVRSGAEAAAGLAGTNGLPLSLLTTDTGLLPALGTAVAQGARGVIGPLTKEQVAELVRQPVDIPAVALNTSDLPPPPSMVALSLSPEDEARAAAMQAVAKGQRRAVVLALDGDWGQRAARAFATTFAANGGVVVTQANLLANAADYGPNVRTALGIAEAEQRLAALRSAGISASLAAAPRSDIDVVFLALRGRQARLVLPQLRYWGGASLPVMGLAAVSDSASVELASVHVCDIPLRQVNPELDALRQSLAGVLPRGVDTQRLFALGFDAYRIALARAMGETEIPAGPWLSGRWTMNMGAAQRDLRCEPPQAPPPAPTWVAPAADGAKPSAEPAQTP